MSEQAKEQLSAEEQIALEVKEAKDAEAAFEAGFTDTEVKVVVDTVKGDPNAEDKDTSTIENKPDKPAEVQEETSEKDEWEGISDTIKKRFMDMETQVTKANQIANAANGQARKLQNQVSQQKVTPPRPTSEQILEAMTDKTKRDALREDWGDFASAMDEADVRVAAAVGAEIDKFKSEMTNEFKQFSESQSNYNIKRDLDINHPGWETTISTDSFKDFIYEGGPSVAERTEYENSLGYAETLRNNSPSESKALYDQANTFYKGLLDKYPTWAVNKGNLYNAPDGESAIKLLDMHKILNKDKPTVEEQQQLSSEKEVILNKNRQILAANVAPTSGKNMQQVAEENQESEAEKAFEQGFNS